MILASAIINILFGLFFVLGGRNKSSRLLGVPAILVGVLVLLTMVAAE